MAERQKFWVSNCLILILIETPRHRAAWMKNVLYVCTYTIDDEEPDSSIDDQQREVEYYDQDNLVVHNLKEAIATFYG
jgi:hypothetical protein